MEIELRRHLPSTKRVEAFLYANPELSRDEAEARLTSYWVNCPAKGEEIPFGEACCQGCPHLGRLDFQSHKLHCQYKPFERRLGVLLKPGRELPTITCPLTEKETNIGNCALCRYHRGGEAEPPHRTEHGEQVGWLLCSAPQAPIHSQRQTTFTLEY
ncbi:MAG: hypothetical protein QMC90_03175 [Dehalococcoidales bacterium]|nr:hypothetical protein [Dehalococcoidales bacterium]